MINLKDLEGSGSGLILRYFPGIHLGGTEANHEKPVRYPVSGPRFEPGLPEYEAGV
jgi:hypothetical protein